MKTIYKIIIVAVMLAATAFGLWILVSPGASRISMTPAKIENVKQMLLLSSVRLYEEVPVKGTVGKRHLVARLVLEGSIDFDLENLSFEESGDTVEVTLPSETVTLRESTRPRSYTVIDTWNDNFFGSKNITTKEENRMKKLAIENARRQVYARGYVGQARADAVNSLKSLLSAALPGKVIIVMDPSPNGMKK